MYDVTRLIPGEQFDKLTKRLPTLRQKRLGRKKCSKKALITGILEVLVLGIPWNKIFDCGCSPTSCYRYFKELQRRGIFKLQLRELSSQKTDITICSIDTDSSTSFRFRYGSSWDGRLHKPATKVSLLSDIQGLPADVVLGTGRKADRDFVSKHFKNTSGRRKRILNLDKIYVSVDMRREMRNHGTYVNMKTRKGDYIRKRGPKFQLKGPEYRSRFLIEKTFAWMENFKRCKYRVDYLMSSYRAFVYLALIIILIRN